MSHICVNLVLHQFMPTTKWAGHNTHPQSKGQHCEQFLRGHRCTYVGPCRRAAPVLRGPVFLRSIASSSHSSQKHSKQIFAPDCIVLPQRSHFVVILPQLPDSHPQELTRVPYHLGTNKTCESQVSMSIFHSSSHANITLPCIQRTGSPL